MPFSSSLNQAIVDLSYCITEEIKLQEIYDNQESQENIQRLNAYCRLIDETLQQTQSFNQLTQGHVDSLTTLMEKEVSLNLAVKGIFFANNPHSLPIKARWELAQAYWQGNNLPFNPTLAQKIAADLCKELDENLEDYAENDTLTYIENSLIRAE